MAPLLIHNDDVPVRARDALKNAYQGPPERQHAMLEVALRILHQETDVECRDLRELVGLEGSC